MHDKIKDKAYVLILDEYSDIGTHWTSLHELNNNVTYFESFRGEHIPEEIKIFIGTKNKKANLFRIQAFDSVKCGYFCIGFIDFMLKVKNLAAFNKLFSPNSFLKNDDIILNYFMTNV